MRLNKNQRTNVSTNRATVGRTSLASTPTVCDASPDAFENLCEWSPQLINDSWSSEDQDIFKKHYGDNRTSTSYSRIADELQQLRAMGWKKGDIKAESASHKLGSSINAKLESSKERGNKMGQSTQRISQTKSGPKITEPGDVKRYTLRMLERLYDDQQPLMTQVNLCDGEPHLTSKQLVKIIPKDPTTLNHTRNRYPVEDRGGSQGKKTFSRGKPLINKCFESKPNSRGKIEYNIFQLSETFNRPKNIRKHCISIAQESKVTRQRQVEASEQVTQRVDRESDSDKTSAETHYGWRIATDSICSELAGSACKDESCRFSTCELTPTIGSGEKSRDECIRRGIMFYYRKVEPIAESEFTESFECSCEKFFLAASDVNVNFKYVENVYCQLGTIMVNSLMTAFQARVTIEPTAMSWPRLAAKETLRAALIGRHYENVEKDVHDNRFCKYVRDTSDGDSCGKLSCHTGPSVSNTKALIVHLDNEFHANESLSVSVKLFSAAKNMQQDGKCQCKKCVNFKLKSLDENQPVGKSDHQSAGPQRLKSTLNDHSFADCESIARGVVVELSSYDSDDSPLGHTSKLTTDTESPTRQASIDSIKRNATRKTGHINKLPKIIAENGPSGKMRSDDTTADIETQKIFQSQEVECDSYAPEVGYTFETGTEPSSRFERPQSETIACVKSGTNNPMENSSNPPDSPQNCFGMAKCRKNTCKQNRVEIRCKYCA